MCQTEITPLSLILESKIRTYSRWVCRERFWLNQQLREAGRYVPRYTPRENRICTKCDSRLLGYEYHFILICTNPVLLDLRNKYISPYYTLQPSLNKLAELFNNKGIKLFKLARFVIEGLKLYQSYVSPFLFFIYIFIVNSLSLAYFMY